METDMRLAIARSHLLTGSPLLDCLAIPRVSDLVEFRA